MFESYKKKVEKLKAAEKLDMGKMVDFVVGKGMIKLPNKDQVLEAFSAMDAASMVDGVNSVEYAKSDKKGWAAEKVLMDCMIISITSTPMTKALAIDQLLQLWKLAHNKRKRQYMIAAISAVVITGGVVVAKYFIDKKNDDSDDDVIGEIEIDEIDYDKDIPEVEIEDVPELA